jgi:NTP pyrophosphatase (non-canonical NTP hydrolase)
MSIKEYTELASKTAIYPENPTAALSYLSLKLVGELGELGEKLDEGAPVLEIIKEAGDVIWYMNELTKLMGLDLVELDDAFKTYTLTSSSPLISLMSKWSETVGKGFRDDGITYQEFSLKRIQTLIRTLGDIWGYLSIVCSDHDTTLLEVMTINIAKLQKRQVEGKLKGEGDNR